MGWAQHLVILFICVFIPISNFINIKKLRNRYSDTAKESSYIKLYLIYWFITGAVVNVMPISSILFSTYTFSYIPSMKIVIWTLIFYSLITSIIPLFFLPFSKLLRKKMVEQYDAQLYPKTNKQQFMFIFVAITVGICEEIIFRGFFYNYLIEQMGVSAWISFILVALLFGIGHFMQGVSGVVTLTIFGLIMGYLYLATGSLLLPILIHIIYDMKAVYIIRILRKKNSM